MTPETGAHFGRCIARCESPIERHFLAALLFLGDYTFEAHDRAPVIARDGTGVELAQQLTIGRYRVDFALYIPGRSPRYFVELDGHTFHANTVAQFTSDTVRQRDIVAAGWTPMRFTGTEVLRDPRRCAAAAMIAMARVADQPGPGPAPPVKARIPRSTDPEIAELQDRVEAADRNGDDREAIRLAGVMRDTLMRKLGG